MTVPMYIKLRMNLQSKSRWGVIVRLIGGRSIGHHQNRLDIEHHGSAFYFYVMHTTKFCTLPNVFKHAIHNIISIIAQHNKCISVFPIEVLIHILIDFIVIVTKWYT